MDIMTALSATSKAIDFARLLQSIDKELSVAEMKAKTAELLATLADVKLALVETRETLASKDNEIAELRKAFAFREENTVVVSGERFEKDSKGGPQGMPFCNRCEVVDGRFIRLAETHGKNGYIAMCPQCKADYGRSHGGYTYEDSRG